MQRFIPLLLLALPAAGATVTNAGISGFSTSVVTASADAYYNPCQGVFCGSDPSFIAAGADVTGMTLGPLRTGFIEMTGIGAGVYGAGRVSIGTYSYLCGEVCAIPEGVWMPFTLGVPFDIDVSADAMILGPVYGAGDISLQFSLFDTTGASVVVYDAAAVPEPATFTAVGLALCGLATRVALNAKRRKPSSWSRCPVGWLRHAHGQHESCVQATAKMKKAPTPKGGSLFPLINFCLRRHTAARTASRAAIPVGW